jgi:hypothetical protein
MLTRYTYLLVLVAAPAFAAPETPTSDDQAWRRELAGHVFVPSLVVSDPFVSTYLSVYAGAGYSWIDGPGFDARGNVFGTESFAIRAPGAVGSGVVEPASIRARGASSPDGLRSNTRSASRCRRAGAATRTGAMCVAGRGVG